MTSTENLKEEKSTFQGRSLKSKANLRSKTETTHLLLVSETNKHTKPKQTIKKPKQTNKIKQKNPKHNKRKQQPTDLKLKDEGTPWRSQILLWSIVYRANST